MYIQEIPIGETLSGRELEEFLSENMEIKIKGIECKLAQYDGDCLFMVWTLFLRQVDELINIYYELNPIEKVIYNDTYIAEAMFPFDDSLDKIEEIIQEHFCKDVKERFHGLVVMFASTSLWCGVHGYRELLNVCTLKQLHDYCCSMRLHYVTMWHLIARHAKGTMKIGLKDVVPEFLTCFTTGFTAIISGYHALVQIKCIPNFEAISTEMGLAFNHGYSQLESCFLEPQRMTELDLEELNPDMKEREKREPYKLYSFQELDVVYANDAIYYEKYGLANHEVYKTFGDLFADVKQFFNDDYSIVIPENNFEELIHKYNKLNLLCKSSDFYDVENTRVAFCRFGDRYYSNFYLLIRFYTNTIYEILRRNRTFQIDSGFLFEDRVVSIVEKYGFVKQQGCTRINHKEFDVVCVKNGCIYNFQCKNNYFNAASIDSNRVNVASHYHKRLSYYYEKALKKEDDREQLLKDKLGIDNIKHFVVSRYPVICNNDRVISFNQLEEWLKAN